MTDVLERSDSRGWLKSKSRPLFSLQIAHLFVKWRWHILYSILCSHKQKLNLVSSGLLIINFSHQNNQIVLCFLLSSVSAWHCEKCSFATYAIISPVMYCKLNLQKSKKHIKKWHELYNPTAVDLQLNVKNPWGWLLKECFWGLYAPLEKGNNSMP